MIQYIYYIMSLIRCLNKMKFGPRCIDCKHYLITGLQHIGTAKCTRVSYRCSDTGLRRFEYAYIARSVDDMCGPDGKYFSPLIRKEN